MGTAPAAESWEAAYVRFESPDQETRKFVGRLRALGADGWPRDAAILDLFCGRGNGLVALEELGFSNVCGVDLSPTLAALHRGRNRCLVGDCRELPLGRAVADIAIVQGGLHHVATFPDDLRRVLAEVSRVLVPGGLLVVVEPWRTPFLDLVHWLTRRQSARRAWAKLDALATMIEHEGDVYRRWLRQPDEILALLAERFEPLVHQTGWGKLNYVGRVRA